MAALQHVQQKPRTPSSRLGLGWNRAGTLRQCGEEGISEHCCRQVKVSARIQADFQRCWEIVCVGVWPQGSLTLSLHGLMFSRFGNTFAGFSVTMNCLPSRIGRVRGVDCRIKVLHSFLAADSETRLVSSDSFCSTSVRCTLHGSTPPPPKRDLPNPTFPGWHWLIGFGQQQICAVSCAICSSSLWPQ